MIISKQIKFDCAHMLSDYDGKCANLHGHTYHGTITIDGPVSNRTDMVLDYNKIKEVVDAFDHAVIFSGANVRNEAEDTLLDWARQYNMKHYIMSDTGDKTTAERMSYEIGQMILGYVPNCTVTVELSETDGSWAKVAVR